MLTESHCEIQLGSLAEGMAESQGIPTATTLDCCPVKMVLTRIVRHSLQNESSSIMSALLAQNALLKTANSILDSRYKHRSKLEFPLLIAAAMILLTIAFITFGRQQ